MTGDDYVIEGTASPVSDPERLEGIARAFEQAYGWHLTREDGTWHGMSDQIRAARLNTYVVRPSIGVEYPRTVLRLKPSRCPEVESAIHRSRHDLGIL